MDQKQDKQEIFQQWLRQPLGQKMLNLEVASVQRIVEKIMGYHGVMVGEESFFDIFQKSPVQHSFFINERYPTQGMTWEASKLYCPIEQLSLDTESVEVIYLAHCLEFAEHPHEILREAYRVLRPEGCIIISVFNKWSLWGIWRLLAKWFQKGPWQGSFWSVLKLKDWLALLGFDMIQTHYLGYGLPGLVKGEVKEPSLWERMGQRMQVPFGAISVIVATKRTVTLLPIKPRWIPRRRLLNNDLAEPSCN